LYFETKIAIITVEKLSSKIRRFPAKQWELKNQEIPCQTVGAKKSGDSLPNSGS
jgi:hypothetical protein